MDSGFRLAGSGFRVVVRASNHKASHYYMGQCPQLACHTEASIEMPAHLSILPVAQRFEGFARNDDTRKTIHALSMLAASWHLVLRHKQET